MFLVPLQGTVVAGTDGTVSGVFTCNLTSYGVKVTLKTVGDIFTGAWRTGFEVTTDIVSLVNMF